jgi:two-component system, cell cycle response regulator DivK
MKTAIVVEDNEANLYMIKYLLKKSGFRVLSARRGVKGVAMVHKQRPDFVVMDIQLPDINGLEATRRIRASEATEKIPIIAVTSYAMVGDREKALAAGCTGYIEKPINPDTFVEELEKFLK